MSDNPLNFVRLTLRFLLLSCQPTELNDDTTPGELWYFDSCSILLELKKLYFCDQRQKTSCTNKRILQTIRKVSWLFAFAPLPFCRHRKMANRRRTIDKALALWLLSSNFTKKDSKRTTSLAPENLEYLNSNHRIIDYLQRNSSLCPLLWSFGNPEPPLFLVGASKNRNQIKVG